MTDNVDNEHEEMVNLLYMWRNNSLTHMTSVVEWIKILLEENPKLGNLTPEQRNFLEIALRNAGQSTEWWRIAVEYTQFHYKIRLPQLRPISIYSIMDSVKFYAKKAPYISELSINIPDDLPMIKGDNFLSTAISYLIFPEPQIACRSQKEPFLPKIAIHKNSGSCVNYVRRTSKAMKSGETRLRFLRNSAIAI